MLNQKPPVYLCTIKSSMCEIGKLRPSGNSIQPPDRHHTRERCSSSPPPFISKPGTVFTSLDEAWNRLIQLLFIIIIIKQGSKQAVFPEQIVNRRRQRFRGRILESKSLPECRCIQQSMFLLCLPLFPFLSFLSVNQNILIIYLTFTPYLSALTRSSKAADKLKRVFFKRKVTL